MRYVRLFLTLSLLTSPATQLDFCDLTCPDSTQKNLVCLNQPCQTVRPCNFAADTDTNNFRVRILNLLNQYRQSIASGENRQQIPKAANMLVLNYDMELEETARCSQFLAKCVPQGDDPSSSCIVTSKFKSVGQTTAFWVPGVRQDYQVAVDTGIKMWFDEIQHAKPTLVPTTKSGNFSQLAWAATTHVGCALYTKNYKMFHLVCNYGVGMDWSKPMFEAGEPCSACNTTGTECSKTYDSLCGVVEDRWQTLDPLSDIDEVLLNSSNTGTHDIEDEWNIPGFEGAKYRKNSALDDRIMTSKIFVIIMTWLIIIYINIFM